MNLRRHTPLHHPGIQLAPLVDVLLLLLIFFLLTWNAARTENELDVKVPKASAAREGLTEALPMFNNHFPKRMIEEFENKRDRKTNEKRPAYGTEIIKELGKE